ncbi:large conductance mechanosensitive channel protein MscL [Brockia lithotrophica]|uniref:Large-conductance mechanosensitive channel n=1 Tax=Brockia lithotrophica TaxID=933949 RepID=A0A660KW67_9BACL|nr:large conductance mechanosensitive channel protein MscL [Brockia lithotrophica]RKQ84253.1 large conductance mechanosensitive channel [Brockia lithotrophica]
MLKGFQEFVMRGNVVELAVAVVIGGAFGRVVNSLVADVITPLIGFIGGTPNFSGLMLGPIALGRFVNAVLDFLLVAAAVYYIVVVPMNEISKRRTRESEVKASAEPSEEVKLLRQILAELRKS